MESIKFIIKGEYKLTPNGIDWTDEKLTVRIQPGEKTIEEIEGEMTVENTARIKVYGDEGDLLRLYTEYKYLNSIAKVKNVPIDIVKVADSVAENTDVQEVENTAESQGEKNDDEKVTELITQLESEHTPTSYHNELAYGDLIEIVLTKSDIRQEVKEIKEVQDEILVKMMEG